MGNKSAVKAAIIGTGDEGCQAMIRSHNRAYLNFIGFCDIRPSQQERAVKEFSNHKDYTAADVKKLKQYANKEEMYDDPDVEMVVIALPLWLHAPVAIEAMKAGKHVFTEKLMAHSVAECKEMCKVARETNRLLAVGHQRHYSALYDNANYLVQNDVLGEIRHIRALWHRNNAQPHGRQGQERQPDHRPQDGPARGRPRQEGATSSTAIAGSAVHPDPDKDVDYKKYGYNEPGRADQLAALQPHRRRPDGRAGQPPARRLLDLPGQEAPAGRHRHRRHVLLHRRPRGRRPRLHRLRVPRQGASDDRIVVTYSSINTNSFEGYGEMVMGSQGTMIVSEEKEILLYKEAGNPLTSRTTSVTVETQGKKPVMETSPSTAGPTAAASLGGLATAEPSRGYREELEHFAYCVRHGNASNYHADTEHQPRCRGEVALADAVIALTSNIAMRQKRRIDFDPRWFDYESPEVPDGNAAIAKRV